MNHINICWFCYENICLKVKYIEKSGMRTGLQGDATNPCPSSFRRGSRPWHNEGDSGSEINRLIYTTNSWSFMNIYVNEKKKNIYIYVRRTAKNLLLFGQLRFCIYCFIMYHCMCLWLFVCMRETCIVCAWLYIRCIIACCGLVMSE